MYSSHTLKIGKARTATTMLALLVLTAMVAFAGDSKNTKTSSAPAKPAAPAARPAAPAHAGGGAGAGASHPTAGGGASASGANAVHHGPTTGNSGAHAGPTTGNPGGVHTGATTSNPTGGHAGPTTSNPTGTHTGPTANSLGGPHGTSNPGHPGATARATNNPTDARSAQPNQRGTGAPGGVHPPGTGGTHATNSGLGGKPAPAGSHFTQAKTGDAMQKRANGKVSDVHVANRGMDVHHGLTGSKRVSVERADHSRIVAERGRPGYVQHSYSYHNREFARRSYYYHGHVYNRYYNRYNYHGRYVEVYAPVRYYPSAFYGWAYNPWYQPVYYSWGWAGVPWYGYYGYYFAPAPVYPTAALWLTDYVIANDLAAAYQAQQEAQMQAGPVTADNGAAPITPEVKQEIAEEVKNQLALENAEAQQNANHQDIDPASSGIARLLADGHPHVFVVGGAMDVVDASSSTECALSDGDALQLVSPPPPDATEAGVVVLSSKGGNECRKGSTVTVSVNDLQDMQNHMRDMVDQGLQELQAKQGKQIPALPPSAAAPPVEAEYAQAAPPADPKGAEEITQQLAEADQAESEVTAEVQKQEPTAPALTERAPEVTANATSTTTIEAGQTIAQVKAELGAPIKIIDLGAKKTYVYKDMKVVFKDGKVADVQ